MNPPNARKIEIHNLIANTKYEFQVMGINQFGDGMFSEIIEASTKGLTHLFADRALFKEAILVATYLLAMLLQLL